MLCRICNIDKELTLYTKCKAAKSGYYSECKECRANWMRQYRKDNPDLFKKLETKRYHKHREKRIHEVKEYYMKHKEEISLKNKINKAKRTESRRRCKEKNKEKYKKTADEYRKNNPEKVKRSGKNSHLKRQYGITLLQYEEMIKLQENKCSICDKISNSSLHIDHNHSTGKVRELLCTNCNTGLGQFKDNIEFLESAIKYLVKHE